MPIHPKKTNTRPACILIEQFRLKGYQCREVKEAEATTLILTHPKKLSSSANALHLPQHILRVN